MHVYVCTEVAFWSKFESAKPAQLTKDSYLSVKAGDTIMIAVFCPLSWLSRLKKLLILRAVVQNAAYKGTVVHISARALLVNSRN